MSRWEKRRAAVEPEIGHLKNDGRLGRNYLLGALGDMINAVLCGCGKEHPQASGVPVRNVRRSLPTPDGR